MRGHGMLGRLAPRRQGESLVIYRVEATTQSGDLVFCHDYTFNELTRLGWVVEIRALNDCPP